MPDRLRIVSAVVACALLGIALLAGSAEAKKKKKGGTSTVVLPGKGGVIPDATVPPDTDGDGLADLSGNGGEYHQGIFTSQITVKKKKEATLKDLNVQVAVRHTDVGDLVFYLVGPRGQFITLAAFNDNYPPSIVFPPADQFHSQGVFGPTTFDDQAPIAIDDDNSCPNPVTEDVAGGACTPPVPDGGGVEAFAPYAGSYRPRDGTLASLGNKLKGIYTLIVIDGDAANDCNPPACAMTDLPDTGSVTSWKLIAQIKGKKRGRHGGKKR